MNVFVALGAKDGFVEINFAKDQMKKLLGNNPNVIIKEYQNYEHQVYIEELKDMKKFLLGIVNNLNDCTKWFNIVCLLKYYNKVVIK